MASRAQLFVQRLPDGRTREPSLLLFARAVAAASPALRPDLPADVAPEYGGTDPILSSLCQFDLLVTVISGVAAAATTERQLLDVSYPNYARAAGRRANAVVRALVSSPDVRQALVASATDRQLALVLHLADQIAQREGFSYDGWDGYDADDVRTFISSCAV